LVPHESPDPLDLNDRDARIEQLLLAGLDEYFATRYEQAINLWTRVLFLDRGHDRARAYIERARSAQAEVQRESEALLQQGFDAFRSGDVARARQLVGDALDRGASHDEAQGMLERIERLGTGQTAPRPRRRVVASPALSDEAFPVTSPAAGRPGFGWSAAILLGLAAFGTLAIGVWGISVPELGTWVLLRQDPTGERRAPIAVAADPLPVVGASEAYFRRARRHFASGRLTDALDQIDRIPIADPLRREADRMRADIQRALLAAVAAEQAMTGDPSTEPAPPRRPIP
jgi:hypothetical protein